VTCPAVRLPTQTQSDHRRPGIFPGRRFASAAAVACVAAAGAVAPPARAAADQAVVSATIFPGTAGSVSSQQVMLSTLDTCDPYQGPSSIALLPSSNQQPISQPAWTLGTILTCGLQIPSGDVNAVQVVAFSGSYESPLSNAQIFDSDQYPGTDGALPTIYVDGGEDQTTYVRPPMSTTDQNAVDSVTEQGDPISVIVFENQPPLVVTTAQSPVAGSQEATEQVTLGATVTAADGTAIPSSALTFSWTVNNAQPLSGPAPVATVGPGVTPVTVQVYDSSTGAGGTATFDITYDPQPSPTPTTNTGPGAGTSKQGHPTGTTKLTGGGKLDHAGTNRGTGTRHTGPHSKTSTHSGTTPAQTSPTPPPANTPPATSPVSPPVAPPTIQTTTVTTPSQTPTPSNPGLTVDTNPTKAPPTTAPPAKAPQHADTHAPTRHSAAQPGASQRLVTGRLVADVRALPEGASPLVHPIAAQAATSRLVHAAGDGTSAPTWAYATLAGLLLLGGGALYERRGRRGRTLHR
jgi:hypothetical protein